MAETSAAGESIAANRRVLEVHVAELRQLFNAIDPAPFHERDLDPRAEEFIVEWSREMPGDARLGLLLRLDQPPQSAGEADQAAQAISAFFAGRAKATRQKLRRLFRVGRTSLIIGLAVLAVFVGAGGLVTRWMRGGGISGVLRESLLIGGWVAMWRPLEVFLYDWWPIRAEVKLFDRLAQMPVRIAVGPSQPTERSPR